MRKRPPDATCPISPGRKMLEEYQMIFDNTVVGIAFTHSDIIVRCNPRCEEIFGYPPGGLEGRAVQSLFPSAMGYQHAQKTASTSLAEGQSFAGELVMQRKSGERFWCTFDGRVIRSDAPERANGRVVWIFQDIDERKKAEQALVDARQELETRVERRTAKLNAANRQLQAEMQARRRIEEKQRRQQAELARMARVNTAGEMVSALAHELGQPLVSMLNYVHGCLLRLASGNATQEELKHGLVQAVRNAEQAGEIVRRVRRFLHKQPPEKHLYDINQILSETGAFLEPEARRLEIVLRIRSSDAPLKALVDRVEIEQVVVNLVKNAFEALANDSTQPKIVEIAAIQNTDDTLTVAVADSGPGVPQYLHTSIFEPFFTTKNKGMGFGLSICASMIEMHGGKIRVADSWLGGALFEIILPQGGKP